jgi:aminopeptidase N
MEHASGQQLGWFFDQWLRRPGFPEIAVTWSSDPSSQEVTLDIQQGTRFGAFRFPLTVEVRGADGSMRRATVQVPAEAHSRLVLPRGMEPPASPRDVIADPSVDLLARIAVHPG